MEKRKRFAALAIAACLVAFVLTGLAERYAPVIFLFLIVAVLSGWDFFAWLRETKGKKREKREVWKRLWPALAALFLIPLHWAELANHAIWIGDGHMPAQTADGLGLEAVYALLWAAAVLVLIRAARRGDRGAPFTPIVLLLMDGWHLAGVLFTLGRSGIAGLRGYLPVGSRPWTKVSTAYLALYVFVRACAAFSLLLSIGLDVRAWRRRQKETGESVRMRWAALAGIILLPILLAFGAFGNHAAVQSRDFEEPVVQIELEDLRNGTRTGYACGALGGMRETEPFEGDALEIFTGRNVYKKDYFNWRITSAIDDPAFTDAQGNGVTMDRKWRAFLRGLEQEDGLAEGVRVIQDGELWFLEVEIADSLWRPFRLYGYDGKRLVLLASYDSCHLTALRVQKPEAFSPVKEPEITVSYLFCIGNLWCGDHQYVAMPRDENGMVMVDIRESVDGPSLCTLETVRSLDFKGIAWDYKTKNLWVKSGDVGLVCYAPDGKGHWLENGEIIPPDYFYSD